MPNLFEAHKQWSNRPSDERFYTLADLLSAVSARREASVASKVFLPQLQFSDTNGQLVLQGANSAAIPSHWAFGQLCSLFDAPAHFLRRVPPELAAVNLNWAAKNAPRDQMQMLWANGSTPGVVRSFNSLIYSRLWDEEVAKWLIELTQNESNGWHRPPAMTDDKYPSGLYAGDRNIFVFMVNEGYRIDDGSEKGLARGFFAWNSEVGQMSFGFKAFLYQYVCGNHIVWGTEELFNVRMFHVGKNMSTRAIRELESVLAGYITSSSAGQQAIVTKARETVFAPTVEGVVERLTERKFGYNNREATELVEETTKRGANPTLVWDLVDSGSRLSQRKPYADERTSLDRRAGRLLEVVF